MYVYLFLHFWHHYYLHLVTIDLYCFLDNSSSQYLMLFCKFFSLFSTSTMSSGYTFAHLHVSESVIAHTYLLCSAQTPSLSYFRVVHFYRFYHCGQLDRFWTVHLLERLLGRVIFGVIVVKIIRNDEDLSVEAQK